MKKVDLVTAIGVAIGGTVLAFAICNWFLGPVKDVTYKTIEQEVTADIAEPDENVFNFKALNPTVEVFVGECENTDEAGNCLDKEEEKSVETKEKEEKAQENE